MVFRILKDEYLEIHLEFDKYKEISTKEENDAFLFVSLILHFNN